MKFFTHINLYRFTKSLVIPFAILALAFSCENSDTDPIDEYDYYPLAVGRFAIYEVNEVVYSSGQANPVSKTWQEKDEVDRVSTDAEGFSTYTVSRSTRNASTDYWQKVKEFTVRKSPDKILTNIDNQTFFSLAFPISPKYEWNGNTYNNLDAESYYYQEINEPASIGAQNFSKTLKVVERNDTSIINRYLGVKQYGLGVGLISDEQIAFEFCQSEDCIGSGKIESGSRKTRKILEYGTR
jgi:hypothetical protein